MRRERTRTNPEPTIKQTNECAPCKCAASGTRILAEGQIFIHGRIAGDSPYFTADCLDHIRSEQTARIEGTVTQTSGLSMYTYRKFERDIDPTDSLSRNNSPQFARSNTNGNHFRRLQDTRYR